MRKYPRRNNKRGHYRKNGISRACLGAISMPVFFLSALCLTAPREASADVLYLKNKKTITGIIGKETAATIAIDNGIGNIFIKKTDIERVEKGAKQDNDALIETWRSAYVDTQRWAPAEGKQFIEEYKQIQDKRSKAIAEQRKQKKALERVAACEKQLAQLMDKYEKKNEELKGSNFYANAVGYNNIVAEMNSLAVEIRDKRSELEACSSEAASIDRAVSFYIEEMGIFQERFNKTFASCAETGCGKYTRLFFEKFEPKVRKLDNDFQRDEISTTTSQGVCVNAVVNSKKSLRLIVDTGASIVVISKKAALALGIKPETIKRKIQVSLADGSLAEATPVTLDSVRVGNSEVKNVFAAISDNEPAPEADGLLGMSFLGNFRIRMDAKAGKLILERFKP